MKYQPALDGIRGFCVASVFFCHAQVLGFGWMGVQAFFVLSGFLITGVLLESKSQGDSGLAFFKGFYARRALRIFPAYFAYLVAVYLLAGFAGPDMAGAVRAHSVEHAPYLVTYTYNFYRINAGPGSPFFAHLWSLSVEEQFYLIWPICIFCLARRGAIRLCLCLAIAGPLIRLLELVWLLRQDSSLMNQAGHFTYFLTSSHVDAFALGALLNFRGDHVRIESLVQSVTRWALPLLILASTFLICTGLIARAHLDPTALGWPIYLQYLHTYVWGYTLLNLAFFAAIANVDRLPVLANPIAQRLGRISYGFYIYHLPILWLAFMLTGAQRGTWTLPNVLAIGVAFVLTWLVSELSFRFLESPFLALKRHFSGRRVPVTAASSERGVFD